MSREFGIIYQDIFQSSLMELPLPIRHVWQNLLILCGPGDVVRMGPSALSHLTRVPENTVREALEIFLSPDPKSRTSTDEGRRIRMLEPGNENAGYLVINKEEWKERNRRDRLEARRSLDTIRKRASRDREKETRVSIVAANVSVTVPQKTGGS